MKRCIACLLALLLVLPFSMGAAAPAEPDIVHYLLLGFDFWGDEEIGVSYSDTNILASIDRTNGRLMVTSLLRDTYVEKPDGTWGRLNNVVRNDGFDVMVQTVSRNYGVEVEYYLAIGVKGLRRVIDELGGIEVTITKSEAEKLQHVSGIRGAGTYTLNSSGVMHYMRLRKIAGHDFSRTERQRKVLEEVLKRVQSMSLSETLAVATVLFEEVETNITLQELFRVVNDVFALRDASLETMYLPIKGGYENVERHGMAVYELDWDMNRAALQAFLHGEYVEAEINAE